MTVALKKKRLNTNCKLERNVYYCQGVKYLNIIFCGGGLYKYLMKNILKATKFLSTWGLSQRFCPGL